MISSLTNPPTSTSLSRRIYLATFLKAWTFAFSPRPSRWVSEVEPNTRLQTP